MFLLTLIYGVSLYINEIISLEKPCSCQFFFLSFASFFTAQSRELLQRAEIVKLGKFIRPPHITYYTKVKHSATILLHPPANWFSPLVSKGALMTDTSGPLCYAAAYLELSRSRTAKISVISWG